MTEGRASPHARHQTGEVTDPEFPWSSFEADGGASQPVARKPRMALRSEDRATAERIAPCHACQKGQ
jgi:hypothetical protein